MENRFEGVGDPAHSKLVWREDFGDYVLQDARYLSAHVFKGARSALPGGEVGLKFDVCAGLRLLRRKLLEDIARADRIFVLAVPWPEADTAMLRRIAAALHRIGPATLLGVFEGGEPGRVTREGDGLLLGRIEALRSEQGPFEQWKSICMAAHALSPPAPRRSGTRGCPPAR